MPSVCSKPQSASDEASRSSSRIRQRELAARAWAIPYFRLGVLEKLDESTLKSCLVLSRPLFAQVVRVLYVNITFEQYIRLRDSHPSFERFVVYHQAVKHVDLTDDLPRLVGVDGYLHLFSIFPSSISVGTPRLSMTVNRAQETPHYTLIRRKEITLSDYKEPFQAPQTYLPPSAIVTQVYQLVYDAETSNLVETDDDGDPVVTLAMTGCLSIPLHSIDIVNLDFDVGSVTELAGFYANTKIDAIGLPSIWSLTGDTPHLPLQSLTETLNELFRAAGRIIHDFQCRVTGHDTYNEDDYSIGLNDIMRFEWDHMQSLQRVDLSCLWPFEDADVKIWSDEREAWVTDRRMLSCPFTLATPNIVRPLPGLSSFTLRIGEGDGGVQSAIHLEEMEQDSVLLPLPEMASALLAIGGPLCTYTILIGRDEADDSETSDGKTLNFFARLLTKMLRHEMELQIGREAGPPGWRKLQDGERHAPLVRGRGPGFYGKRSSLRSTRQGKRGRWRLHPGKSIHSKKIDEVGIGGM